jgi:peptidoglycan/xylan/chitin deacetylase (PgdA/CDA1 family)
MRIRRLLVILLMLPIFLVVADKYLLGGILRYQFMRAVTSAANSNDQPIPANVPVPCDTVSKVYNVELTRLNGAWHLVRTADPATTIAQAATGTEEATITKGALSAAQLRDEADISDLYQVDNSGPTVTINNLHPDQSCSFSAVINDVKSYSSIQTTATTDIPSDRTIATFRAYEQEDFLPIFGYHFVVPDEVLKPGPLEIPLTQFITQVEFATNQMGCHWYTFGDIMRNYVLAGKKTPVRACVMTFDDGQRSNYDVAFPVLRYYGITASFFIIPSQIGLTTDYMTWNQINELAQAGNEIGLHPLSASSGDLQQANNVVQISNDFTKLSGLAEAKGYPIHTFAYALNGWNSQAVMALKSGKYLAARDGEKPDLWRDRRTSTASMDSDFIWHMYYLRPDHKIVLNDQGNPITIAGSQSPQDLANALGYNTWWQFEEGYSVNAGQPVVDSSYHPTPQSYGVVKLNAGDSISNKFILSQDGKFTLNLYMAAQNNGFKVSIDGTAVDHLEPANNCALSAPSFCQHLVNASLTSGAHTLTIEAQESQLLLDKFNIFTTVSNQDTFQMQIVEYGSGTLRQTNINGVALE